MQRYIEKVKISKKDVRKRMKMRELIGKLENVEGVNGCKRRLWNSGEKDSVGRLWDVVILF